MCALLVAILFHDIQEGPVPPRCSLANTANIEISEGNPFVTYPLAICSDDILAILKYDLILFITLINKNIQHSVLVIILCISITFIFTF